MISNESEPALSAAPLPRSSESVAARLSRYVPLAVWLVVLFTCLLIPLKIISYGYLPKDDALRHAAKAVSGTPWQEILVMRSDFVLDPDRKSTRLNSSHG